MSMTKKGQKKPTNKPQINCGKGRTKQEFKEIVDIDNIIKQHRVNGTLETLSDKIPEYGDCSNERTYQESMQIVINAKAHFEALPSKIRTRFANNPAEMLGYLEDPANREEAEYLGMVKKKDEKVKGQDSKTNVEGNPENVHTEKVPSPQGKDAKKITGN